MKSILLFCIHVISFAAFAGTPIVGVVLDKSSGKPLPYATVSFVNGQYGIITDESGTFRLEVDKITDQDTLQISYVGYQTLRKTTADLKKDGTCRLETMTFEIQEVEIKPLMAEDILRLAYDKFYPNHIHKDVAVNGYYREQFFEGQECVRYGESVFATKTYQVKGKDMVSIVPYLARSVEDSAFVKKFNHIFNVRKQVIPLGIDEYYKNGMVENYKIDKYYKFLGQVFFDGGSDGFKIKYQRTENHALNGRENYYIRFEVHKKKYHIASGHFLIDQENHGIAAFEVHFIEQEDLTKRILSPKVRLIMKLLGYGAEVKGFEAKIYNRFVDGKWYIGNGVSIIQGGIAKGGDWVRGKGIIEFYAFYTEKVAKVEKKTTMKDQRTYDFNTSFWNGRPHLPIQPKHQEYIDKMMAKNANFSGEVNTKMVQMKIAKKEKKEAKLELELEAEGK
jgi:hypothetical protein